jgi:hypothetical protein
VIAEFVAVPNKLPSTAGRRRKDVRVVVCEGTRDNLAPRSARGIRSITDLRPRRRSPQRSTCRSAGVAGRLRGRDDFEWHFFPWPSQGLDCPARLRALTDRDTHTLGFFSEAVLLSLARDVRRGPAA